MMLQVERVEDHEVVARVEAERDAAVDPARPERVRHNKEQRHEEEEPEPEGHGREQRREPQGQPFATCSLISGALHFGEDALVLARRLPGVLDDLQPLEDVCPSRT